MPSRANFVLVAILSLTSPTQSLADQAGPNPDPSPAARPPDETHYSVAERGANYKTLQKITYEPGPSGLFVPKVHRVVQVATGMHYQQTPDGPWLESQRQIQLLPDLSGAAASQGQTKVFFPSDIYNGALETTGPDGVKLRCRPVCLAYADAQRSALIAELTTNSTAFLLSPSSVLYSNICTDLRLDLLVTYKLSGCRSDLIIREPLPDPREYGFTNANSTIYLQWWTEWFDNPQPVIKSGRSSSDGLSDSTLVFSKLRMPPGTAFFAAGQEEPLTAASTGNGARVYKDWVNVDGRTFLIEELPLRRLEPQLNKLAALAQPSPLLASSNLHHKRGEQLKSSPTKSRPGSSREASGILNPPTPQLARNPVNLAPLLPASRRVQPSTGRIQLASTTLLRQPGVILDWELLDVDQTNFVFQSDSTYYVTDMLSLYGATVEGNCVIKLAPANDGNDSAWLIIWDYFKCLTGPMRPGILTAASDDSVGETLDDSTGTPADYWQAFAFGTDDPITATNLQVRYATYGLNFGTQMASAEVANVQFLHCGNPIFAQNNTVALHNVLFYDATNALNGFDYIINLEHATINGCNRLSVDDWADDANDIINLTNSLLVDLASWTDATVTTNNTAITNGANQVFQSIVGGSSYLVANSPYRDAGSTNVSQAMLNILRNTTTYPPVVYSNATISTDTSFAPQAQRDTDTPDLGYHYDPLDYLFGNATADANLSFAPGTAAGWFRTVYNTVGIQLNDRKTVTFNGTEETPCAWVRYNTVQDAATDSYLWGPGGVCGSAWPYITNSPELVARFTLFSCLAADGQNYRDNYGWLTARCTDCEFHGGDVGFYNVRHFLTNCLFDRCGVFLNTTVPDSRVAMRNCTMRGRNLDLYRFDSGTNAAVSIRDCAFDGGPVNTALAGTNSSLTDFDYNAFLTNAPRTTPIGAHDILVTNFNWKAGPLGNFYLPTNSPLMNTGSVTADIAGLFHFTVTTNFISGLQVKETNSVVDIGYHYVAVTTNAVPIDTDGDGLADYVEDTNGDGTYNAGDVADWHLPDTDGDGTNDYLELIQGRNPGIAGTISDTNGVINLQVFTPLK
jgi:hypothetical protein